MKYYDIGETVRRAVAVAARSGATFLTVHGVGQVMRAAIEGRADSTMKLLAVTVLTSFDQKDVQELDYEFSLAELVSRRARLAMQTGVDGLVASPLEARTIRAQTGPGSILVTPGVRSRGAAVGDQKRVATPSRSRPRRRRLRRDRTPGDTFGRPCRRSRSHSLGTGVLRAWNRSPYFSRTTVTTPSSGC